MATKVKEKFLILFYHHTLLDKYIENSILIEEKNFYKNIKALSAYYFTKISDTIKDLYADVEGISTIYADYDIETEIIYLVTAEKRDGISKSYMNILEKGLNNSFSIISKEFEKQNESMSSDAKQSIASTLEFLGNYIKYNKRAIHESKY